MKERSRRENGMGETGRGRKWDGGKELRKEEKNRSWEEIGNIIKRGIKDKRRKKVSIGRKR